MEFNSKSELVVVGGARLEGSVGVLGAKNAVLPDMLATLLAPGTYRLTNVPGILDVRIMGAVLAHLGAQCVAEAGSLTITVPDELRPEAPIDLVRRMRASILALGPLLGRCGEARVAFPGGDDFGTRPIDMHLDGLRAMGASFELVHGVLVGKAADGLRGAEIYLDFPSVGATENLLLAGVTARGRTVIENAAREPELEDLAALLSSMGADISGAGTSSIVVNGVGTLSPTDHSVVPDRLEAGTYLAAAAVTKGSVEVVDCVPGHLRMELRKLQDAGCEVETGTSSVRLQGPERPTPVDFATLPYPGFHTDMHPQLVTLLSLASGTSVITENLYAARFRYIGELNRMGADILTEGQHLVIHGVDRLEGCEVDASDIRAGAALVNAALRAEGETVVKEAHHIDRGYQDIVGVLTSLGGNIERRPAEG